MIVSLAFNKKYNASVNEHGYFNLKVKKKDTSGETVKFEKQSISEIPFIRYRFDSYGPDEINYIRKMQQTFNQSAHLAEIIVKDPQVALDSVKCLKANLEKICVFVKFEMNDEIAQYITENRQFSGDIGEHMADFKNLGVDQFSVKDCTSCCSIETMNEARRVVARNVYGTETRYNKIGICSSPLCFCEAETACLTAAKSREYMARYAVTGVGGCTPSANHQSDENCSGCIRYFIVDQDITPYMTKAASNKTGAGAGKTKTDKNAKQPAEKPVETYQQKYNRLAKSGKLSIKDLPF